MEKRRWRGLVVYEPPRQHYFSVNQLYKLHYHHFKMVKDSLEKKFQETIRTIRTLTDNVIDINMKMSHIIHYLRKDNYPQSSEEPYRPDNDY